MSTQELPPHVLIFPLPLQGHVNSMLKLAELLCLAGLHVTFLATEDIHRRLLRHADVTSRLGCYTGFRFETISYGFPADSVAVQVTDMLTSMKTTVKQLFRELMVPNRLQSETRRPVSCIIADGLLSFASGLGAEMGIPVIFFRTASASSFWTYFCLPKLIESGELPFDGLDDLDVPIKNVQGMEGFLRRRDLPGLCRGIDLSNPDLQYVMTETQQTLGSHGLTLILNTFEDLEGPVLSHIRTQIPNIYSIGPLHTHLKLRAGEKENNFSNSFLEEDMSCLTWLDSQPINSVIYVSFGSIAVVTTAQLMEFWYGLVNSGKRFLWVLRSDMINGEEETPEEILKGTKERGFIVGWAPQEEVLRHPSVGGFLTHSGWNSTLESITMGKPMICWPYFADQQVNSRFIGEVWKIGLDMKDRCDRSTIEKMVRDLMQGEGKDEIAESINRMAEAARDALDGGGSSFCDLERLISDIKGMC